MDRAPYTTHTLNVLDYGHWYLLAIVAVGAVLFAAAMIRAHGERKH